MGRRIDYITGIHEFHHLNAGQFMEGDVTTCHQGTKADKIAIAITSGHFGSLPVVDGENRLVGIISEFDLLKALRAGKDLEAVTVQDLMTTKAISVREGAQADEVMQVLEENHFIRVPVVDNEGIVTGILSRTDILKGYLASTTGVKPWWM